MLKKTIPFLFLLILNLGAAQTELKFNLASALILTPNIGIEVQLSEKLIFDKSEKFWEYVEKLKLNRNINTVNDLNIFDILKLLI